MDLLLLREDLEGRCHDGNPNDKDRRFGLTIGACSPPGELNAVLEGPRQQMVKYHIGPIQRPLGIDLPRRGDFDICWLGQGICHHLERVLSNRTGAFDGDVSSRFRD